jgi:hypothetical protein
MKGFSDPAYDKHHEARNRAGILTIQLGIVADTAAPSF